MPGPSQQVVIFVWEVSMLLAVAVTVVVAILLQAVVNSTQRIYRTASDIWTDGQRVANNTVQIALLDRTNHLVEGILREALGVAKATRQLVEATRRAGGRG